MKQFLCLVTDSDVYPFKEISDVDTVYSRVYAAEHNGHTV